MTAPAPKSWFNRKDQPSPELDLNAIARKVTAAQTAVADAEEKQRDAGKLVEIARAELELARKELREAMTAFGVEG